MREHTIFYTICNKIHIIAQMCVTRADMFYNISLFLEIRHVQ